jgi:hypothetical protein
MDFIVGELVNVKWYDHARSSGWSEARGMITSYDIEYHDDDEEYHYQVVLTSGCKKHLPQDCLTAIVPKKEEEKSE